MILTAAFWLIRPSATISVPGDSFKIVRAWQQWGVVAIGSGPDGKQLVIGGKPEHSGIGTHANSLIVVKLLKSGRLVRGGCGLTDAAMKSEKASIECVVREKGTELFRSVPLNSAHPAVQFEVSYPESGELELVVEDGKNGNNFDHAGWINLEIVQ